MREPRKPQPPAVAHESVLPCRSVMVMIVLLKEACTCAIASSTFLRAFFVFLGAAAGAAPDTLALLVNRRLLRIEERLDVRRVELTHDVLCSVVKASRDQRQEREAREATERLLAEQRHEDLRLLLAKTG